MYTIQLHCHMSILTHLSTCSEEGMVAAAGDIDLWEGRSLSDCSAMQLSAPVELSDIESFIWRKFARCPGTFELSSVNDGRAESLARYKQST